jgi:hypothetical protein
VLISRIIVEVIQGVYVCFCMYEVSHIPKIPGPDNSDVFLTWEQSVKEGGVGLGVNVNVATVCGFCGGTFLGVYK